MKISKWKSVQSPKYSPIVFYQHTHHPLSPSICPSIAHLLFGFSNSLTFPTHDDDGNNDNNPDLLVLFGILNPFADPLFPADSSESRRFTGASILGSSDYLKQRAFMKTIFSDNIKLCGWKWRQNILTNTQQSLIKSYSFILINAMLGMKLKKKNAFNNVSNSDRVSQQRNNENAGILKDP